MCGCQSVGLLLALLFSYERTIQGRIENPDGTPAVGAKVIAVRMSPVPVNDERQTVATDEQGEFTFRLFGQPNQTTSWYLLALKGEHYGVFDQTVQIPAADGKGPAEGPDASQPLVVRLLPGKRLFGTVFHEVTRQPIPLARLYTRQGQFARTDRQGRFEFHGVPSSVEVIMVKSIGKSTRLIQVDLSERPSAEVDIFLSPGVTVQGCLLNQAGQPVPNARVERIGSGNRLLNYASAVTANDGRFELDDFPINTLMTPLQVTVAGYEERNDEMFPTASADQPTELTLRVVKVEKEGGQPPLMAALAGGAQDPEVGAIRGRVIDPQGRPVRNFSVGYLLPSNLEPADWATANGVRSFSEDDGRFVVGRLEATKRYRVAVMAPGFGRAEVEPIYANLAKDQKEIEFRLTEPYQLVVKVFDQKNQQPISDVMVGLSGRHFNKGDFDWNYRLHEAQILRTHADGQVTFDKLPMKEARLFLRKPGYVRHQQPWVDNGKPVEINLEPEARVLVTLKLKTPRVISGLNIKFRSENGDVCYERSKDNSPSPTIRIDQLLPGSCTLEIYDGFAKEPWNAVVTRNIDLKPGDNVLEMEIP